MVEQARWYRLGVAALAIAGPVYLLVISRANIAARRDAFLVAGALVSWAYCVVSLALVHRASPATPVLAGLAAGGCSVLWGIAGPSEVALHALGLSLAFSPASRKPFHAVLFCGVAAACTAAGLIVLGDDYSALLTTALLGTTAAAFSGFLVRDYGTWVEERLRFDRARAAAADFARINTRVLDSMDVASWESKRAERTRVAREIHDTVGYTLTAVLLQTQAAEDVLRVEPEQMESRLQRLQTMIRDAIQDVREEVHRLRRETDRNLRGKSRWAELCRVFSESSGVRVDATIDESLETVPEPVGDAVYRIVQESLINALRHGQAGYVAVFAEWVPSEQMIYLKVSDDGRGASIVSPGSGLSGIQERARALGGIVAWETQQERGFDLGVEIPWDGNVDGKDQGADSR